MPSIPISIHLPRRWKDTMIMAAAITRIVNTRGEVPGQAALQLTRCFWCRVSKTRSYMAKFRDKASLYMFGSSLSMSNAAICTSLNLSGIQEADATKGGAA